MKELLGWRSSQLLFGTAIGAAGVAWTDFFGQNVIKPFWTAASTIEVSSSSVADVDLSGNGAWKIRVYGLDVNYLPITEDFALNGQTGVIGTKNFFRVNGAEVIQVQPGYSNIGDIYVYGSGDTPATGVPAAPATYLGAKIIAGEAVARNASFTVPDGSSIAIFGITFGLYDTAARYARARFGIQTIEQQFFKYYPIAGLGTEAANMDVSFRTPLILRPRTDFRLQMINSAAGSTIDAVLGVGIVE